MRLRADQFFSNIPYQRMVSALSQLTAIPDRQQQQTAGSQQAGTRNKNSKDSNNPHEKICMDELLREVILSTHAYSDPFSSYYGDNDFCDLDYLVSPQIRSYCIKFDSFAILLLCLNILTYRLALFHSHPALPNLQWGIPSSWPRRLSPTSGPTINRFLRNSTSHNLQLSMLP